MPEPKTPAFVCDECGRSFSLQRGLNRHRSETHGAPRSAMALQKQAEKDKRRAAIGVLDTVPLAELRNQDTVSFQVRAQLRTLASPLREQLSEIEKRLVALDREQRDLRDARNQIERTLRGLEGTPAPAKGAGNLSGTTHARKRKLIEEFIATHRRELAGGFTNTSLWEMMDNGGRNGIGLDMSRKLLRELHEAGIIRADKVVQGGAQHYLIVGNG